MLVSFYIVRYYDILINILYKRIDITLNIFLSNGVIKKLINLPIHKNKVLCLIQQYFKILKINMDADFEDLSHDVELISRLKQLYQATLRFEDRIDLANDPAIYDKLSNSDKIKYNLLMSYSLNSMFWMYLRTEGIDPTKHQIKNENDRLKKSMERAKQINDKNTLMPRVDKNAAQRFIRNSLWEPKVNEKDNNENK
ncbi:uncharacterized protein LOC122634349 isoform X1 [Vespula pensylvanica]|nr:uncharacterized protein LOC122634349 isoform X1 [Vespula pensylvanica]